MHFIFISTNQPPTTTFLSQTYTQQLPPSNNLPNIPVKRLSSSELQERSENSLYYSCDEKFVPGHKHRGRFSLLVQQDENTAETNLQEPTVGSPSTSITELPSNTQF